MSQFDPMDVDSEVPAQPAPPPPRPHPDNPHHSNHAYPSNLGAPKSSPYGGFYQPWRETPHAPEMVDSGDEMDYEAEGEEHIFKKHPRSRNAATDTHHAESDSEDAAEREQREAQWFKRHQEQYAQEENFRAQQARSYSEMNERRRAQAEQKKQEDRERARRAWEEGLRSAKRVEEEAAAKRAASAARRDIPRLTYSELHAARLAFLSDPTSRPFPNVAAGSGGSCTERKCSESQELGCCRHDLKLILLGSGKYSKVWLKKERLFWHPDKFSGRGNGPVLADEVFKMIQGLLED